MTEILQAPFPYFGGKSRIAAKVWQLLGQPRHYIEPFFGSGAVLLARPDYDPTKHIESIDDKDGFVANVWRSLQASPDEVAKYCDWPVNHADLCARRRALLKNEDRLLENLVADEKWCDPIMAGYWIWAASCWIGSGLTCLNARPHLGDTGTGINALGKIPRLGNTGEGINAIGKIPQLSDDTMNVQAPYNTNLYQWFRRLSERLRYVRVVCGDWTRVCGGNWQDRMGDVGMYFDPPYGVTDRATDIYHEESITVAKDVETWCLARGDRPSYRIVISGYDTEYKSLVENGWGVFKWSAGAGYSTSDNNNRHRERLFISPHCVKEGVLL